MLLHSANTTIPVTSISDMARNTGDFLFLELGAMRVDLHKVVFEVRDRDATVSDLAHVLAWGLDAELQQLGELAASTSNQQLQRAVELANAEMVDGLDICIHFMEHGKVPTC